MQMIAVRRIVHLSWVNVGWQNFISDNWYDCNRRIFSWNIYSGWQPIVYLEPRKRNPGRCRPGRH
jgi:hypothetical protein